MDDCTRPSHKSRQTGLRTWHRLAASFCLALVLWEPLHAAAAPGSEDLDAIETASRDAASNYEIKVAVVEEGSEYVSLSARLAEKSTRFAKHVRWRIFDDTGAKLLDEEALDPHLPLKPGFYRAEIALGALHITENFTVLAGTGVTLNFVLQAGAMRILPQIKGGLSESITSRSLVYALSGKQAGKLLAESGMPGEVLTLPAGTYRVESRLGLGNAIAVADVEVKPGIISAVEIRHNAGLAQLALAEPKPGPVEWEIRQGTITLVSNLNTASASLVLRPGTYTAVARTGARIRTMDFVITPGAVIAVVMAE